MAAVEVQAAGAEHHGTVANLFQLYVHDFSEQWAGEARGALADDGLFHLDYPLASYWDEPDRSALLIRAGGELAGFALLDGQSHTGLPVDRNMAEFFVARKHRRGGVGLAAAQAIFSRHPGRWEAAVARRNLAALAFWRRAVGSHPQADEVEEIDLHDTAWNGVVLRFRIGG